MVVVCYGECRMPSVQESDGLWVKTANFCVPLLMLILKSMLETEIDDYSHKDNIVYCKL